MFLDLRNNELIFSDIEDTGEFRSVLKELKGINYREYKNKFYFSLADVHMLRKVIGYRYRQDITISKRYKQFAEHFIFRKHDIEIKWGVVECEIRGENMPWKDIIPATSYFDKKAVHAKQYGKSWSGYTHLFNALEGTFPSGLLERVVNILREKNIPFNIEKTFSYPEPYLDLNPVFDFEPTEDQVNSVIALDKANNGIGKLPTGFGKTSYVAASLIARKKVRAIFLANQRVLVDDAKKDFENVFRNDDVTIGSISDGVFNPADITVASIQSIASALKPPTKKEKENAEYQYQLAQERYEFFEEGKDKDEAKKDVTKFKRRVNSIYKRLDRHEKIIPFLKEVDLFVVDESQVLGTDQWNTFLYACPAPYRYTLSATDTRTDGGRIQIVAATGERRFESSAGEQIGKGRLSEFIGHFTKFDHKMEKSVIKELSMSYHQAYEIFIVRNEIRNRHLCKKVIEWQKDYSVLALVTRIEHGEIIIEMLKEMGLEDGKARYIDGETPKKVRRDTIEEFRQGKFPVLIGTSIFDVGFNAKNAAKMVRFNAGGSEVREPQRAGRTVRVREDGSIGESYDLIDINCPFFESQGWKRYKFLKEEFGKNRMKFHRGVIEGELNVVGLREIIDSLPEETDREKGEDIIRQLKFHSKDEDEFDDFDMPDLEPDLEAALKDLTDNA